MKRPLRGSERIINILNAQRVLEPFGIVAHHQFELVTNIHQRIIDRGRGQHQHFHVRIGL
ncbi:hypothetical protein U27_03199 [Candidatus Vecturithrix granuli]|uniref:Uncharacterized protein n=1 Tax=Vecturithrix granuli TaxID=1499967 RepID=A0A081BV82_VECG1|nr:hypothetical protein U27_03199 [Candidatus Vecturithrix granuli]